MKFKTNQEIRELRENGLHDKADLELARIKQALAFKMPESEKKRLTKLFMKTLHGV
jgi:hypothetical protein